ncbi:MAG: amino acid transporter [Gemmatimonadetes bacterium GWC2_71_9]|nr:MAG: amino acid transporter [Gemmatimonadetes bacterium GWC2_71_9]
MTERKNSFVQGINLTAAIALVVGSMIGSGIFIVSADISRQVGAPGLLLAVWALTGVVTIMGALTQGELAAMYPKAGGQYVYLREGLSPLWGFLYGWTLFMVIQTGTIAAVAVAFSRFLGVLLPAVSPDVFLSLGHVPAPGDVLFTLLGRPPATPSFIDVGVSWQRVVGIGTVLLLTWINVQGVRTGAWIQTVLTSVKVVALGGLILLGLTIGRQAAAASQNLGGFWGTTQFSLTLLTVIGAAMVGSLFSSDAWNNVTFAAAEVQNPKRNLPLALFTGTLVVTLLYVLANVAYLNVLPLDQIRNAPQDRVGTAAAQVIFGEAGRTIMAIAIMISTFGCNNGLILSGARVYWAMARDGLFFRSVGALDSTHHTPKVALWVQALWTSLLALSGTYSQLLDYVIFAAVLFYFLTVIALFRLRQLKPQAERPYRVVGYPWMPAVYCALTGLIMVNLLFKKPLYTWPGLIIVMIGIPVYLVWKRVGVAAAEEPASAA